MKTLLLLLVLTSSTSAATHEADVCVFGGTSGGVAAAVQAARMGKTVILAEPGKHLGGMTSGGLSAVDIGDPRSVGGIAREVFTQLAATAGVTLAWDKPFSGDGGGGPATGGAYAIEPHHAEQVFNDMVKQAGVKVHFNTRLATVKKDGSDQSFAWRDLTVTSTASHVILARKPREAIIIPLRAFANHEEMSAFSAFAEAAGRDPQNVSREDDNNNKKEITQ